MGRLLRGTAKKTEEDKAGEKRARMLRSRVLQCELAKAQKDASGEALEVYKKHEAKLMKLSPAAQLQFHEAYKRTGKDLAQALDMVPTITKTTYDSLKRVELSVTAGVPKAGPAGTPGPLFFHSVHASGVFVRKQT